MDKVLIGIQARSGSQRLPNKAFALIAGRTMLDRVIETCNVASKYLQKKGDFHPIVAVLTPEGDPIARDFSSRANVFEADEYDVLSRYYKAMEYYQASYVVRVTGDCPMLPPATVDGMVSLAIRNRYDYISNVDEHFRTTIDGVDCEVMTAGMLKWAHTAATTPQDREHVTTVIRRLRPPHARLGFVCSNLDLSGLKLSVDTEEDLERVRDYFERSFHKYRAAVQTYGNGMVHRL